jgi:small subunit ribosomal protein S21
MPVDVNLRKGETIDKALRRLKKKLDRESILHDVRAKRYFEKPCEKRRRLKKVAVFNNMLRRKYENM